METNWNWPSFCCYRCVLRKKNWRTPSIVYGNDDDNMIDMMYIFKNWEMYLQVNKKKKYQPEKNR